MSTPIVGHGAWMGMVFALCLGVAEVRAQDTASTTSGGSANNPPASPVAKAGKKRELTAEQKAFEESIKAIHARSVRMTVDGVKAARQREKARRAAENKGRTPISLSGASDGNGAGNPGNQNPGNQGGSSSDSSANGKGGKGK